MAEKIRYSWISTDSLQRKSGGEEAKQNEKKSNGAIKLN